MKKLRMIFSIFAFVLAVTAAFATTSADTFMASVWQKPASGGACSPTACLVSGPKDCSTPGYMYFTNPSCLGSSISPKRN